MQDKEKMLELQSEKKMAVSLLVLASDNGTMLWVLIQTEVTQVCNY